VRFHLFQKPTDLFTVVTVSNKTNQQIQMTEVSKMTQENQGEMTDVQDLGMTEESLAEMTEENPVLNQSLRDYRKNKRVSFLMVLTNSTSHLKKNYLKF